MSHEQDDFRFGIEPVGEDVFRTSLPGFGGVTLGAATYAAARTCDDKVLHTLQACFVRPIPPEEEVELAVERISDGRRFARRRVELAIGKRIHFTALASFAAASTGPEFADTTSDWPAPPPEELPSHEEVAREEGWPDADHPEPLDWRWVGRPWDVATGEPSHYRAWVRPRFAPPRDHAEHAAAVALLADYHSHWPVARALGGEPHFETTGFTSLDQLVWLHRDLPWDDWRLIASEAPIGHAGRALGHRRLYARDGRLVASMTQEAMLPTAQLLP